MYEISLSSVYSLGSFLRERLTHISILLINCGGEESVIAGGISPCDGTSLPGWRGGKGQSLLH